MTDHNEGTEVDRALLTRLARRSTPVAAQMATAMEPAVDAADAAPHLLRLFLETLETGQPPTADVLTIARAAGVDGAERGAELGDLVAAFERATGAAWRALRETAGVGHDVSLLEAAPLVLAYSHALTTAAAAAFLDERLHRASAVQAAEWALVDAFLAGRPTAEAAARAGRALADAYGVLLLQGQVAREHLRPFEEAIAALAAGAALWRLTAAGANVLVPVAPEDAATWLDEADGLVAQLSEAGGSAPLVATVAWGEGADGVARAGDDAVQVLRLVTGLGRPPGLYRLDDVLLEAALSGTAAGPAARLSAILAPLEGTGGPELLATLEAYLAHDADRRRTATALHIHPNTLDYRLRRIGELTGRSPATARGLQVLGAALTLQRVGRIRGAPRSVGSG